MKFSYFCNPTNLAHQRDYLAILNELRELSAYCDAGGFHTIWFAEHHFSLWGREMLPNPIILGTDIAARTERIRIGLAAAIITFWHPLRLAEDVALLDQLSNGRVELGLGRGNYGIEGVNLNPMADPNKPDENYAVFEDTLNILKLAFANNRFSYRGKKYTFPNPGFREDQAHPVNLPDYIDAQTGEMVKISVYPRPRQQPTPPLWQVVDGERSIEFAARNDLGIIMWRPPVRALRERFQLYKNTYEKASGRSIAFGKRCGIVRDTFVAPTMKEARERAEKAVMGTLNWSNWRGPSIFLNPGETLDAGAQAALKKELTFDFVNDRSLLVGTPDYVAEKIAELRDELDLEQMVIACHWPGLPHTDTMSSVRLFAEEVMPRFASETERTDAAA